MSSPTCAHRFHPDACFACRHAPEEAVRQISRTRPGMGITRAKFADTCKRCCYPYEVGDPVASPTQALARAGAPLSRRA